MIQLIGYVGEAKNEIKLCGILRNAQTFNNRADGEYSYENIKRDW